jgi:hypothetical protein
MERSTESIYKLAGTVRKIKKNDAYDIISKVAQGEELTDYQVAQLLSFFITDIAPGKVKTPFEWCTLALCTDQKKPNILYVHVANGKACATDGYRIHQTDTHLPDGFYTKKGEKINHERAYPNAAVILDHEYTLPVYFFEEKMLPVKGALKRLAVLKDANGRTLYIDANFYKHALVTMDKVSIFTADVEGFSPVKITDYSGKVAVIMTMNIDHE